MNNLDYKSSTNGVGPSRVYLDIQSTRPNVAYPPRPVADSVADLDIIMEHCDFSANKVSIPYIASLYPADFAGSMFEIASKCCV